METQTQEVTVKGERSMRRALIVLGAGAPIALVGGAALAVPPDPATLAGGLADTAGSAMLSAIVSVLPVLVPVLVGFWAIGFTWSKIGPKRHGL